MSRDSSKITLRQLEIFVSAVEHRSFAKAAKQMGLSASAVSMQMSNLGDQFGVTLFEKEGRNIRPTPVATAIVPYAERITATVDDMVNVVSGLKGEMDSRVRVAMVTTARNFGPHLIKAFTDAHPEIDVDITIDNRRGVVNALQSRQVDLALMGRMPKRIEVDEKRFSEHPYVLVAAPSHPLAKASKIRREDLSMHPFLVRESGSGTRMVHDHFFQDAGVPLPKAREMDSNANIKQAVMANMGLAFISAHTIGLELSVNRLCILNVEGMPELRDWFVLNLKGVELGAAGTTFRDFISREGPGFMKSFFEDVL